MRSCALWGLAPLGEFLDPLFPFYFEILLFSTVLIWCEKFVYNFFEWFFQYVQVFLRGLNLRIYQWNISTKIDIRTWEMFLHRQMKLKLTGPSFWPNSPENFHPWHVCNLVSMRAWISLDIKFYVQHFDLPIILNNSTKELLWYI